MTPMETSRVEGRDIPTTWRIEVPERDADLTVRAIYPQSWMGTRVAYWEGPVTVAGSHEGTGYLEMSGYD